MKLTKDRIAFAKKSYEKRVFNKIRVSRMEFNEELVLCEFLTFIQRELRKKHMTKYALAKKAGLKPQAVARVFNNGENAEVGTLSKIAHGVNKRLVLKLV